MPALNVESYAWLLAEHMELDHEREMPGHWTYKELNKAHQAMHRIIGGSNHNHD